MRYVFFGTPEFAAIALEELIRAGFPPVALVANPDRPVGRKKIITPPATKSLILERLPDAKIFQPEKASEIEDELKSLDTDLFIVAAYAKILPQRILDIPKHGTLGIHPSLLPNYRGSSPIQTAILNGEKETGVSIYILDKETDHGPVLGEEKLPCENVPFRELMPQLAKLGGALAARLAPEYISDRIIPQEQEHTRATFTKKFSTQDGFISFDDLAKAQAEDTELARSVHHLVLALNPEPGTWTEKDGKRFKILETEVDGPKLLIRRIQKEGETPKTFSGFQ